MKHLYSILGVAASLLGATCLAAATPAPKARITLVEHTAAPDSAPGAPAGASPSIVRKQLPGEPVREAHLFAQKPKLGAEATEAVEVAFHERTTLVKIDASNDFRVISGGSCHENQVYSAGATCSVNVAFKGTGPGHRAGRLSFTSVESARPDVIGLQGETLGAAIAFTPAMITTLPQSDPNGVPLLYWPGDVVVDQGDNLYISDEFVGSKTASGVVYFMDGSQSMITIAGGGTTKVNSQGGRDWGVDTFLNSPIGLATDPFLDLYIAEFNGNSVDILEQNQLRDYIGLGTGNPANCTESSTPPSCNTLNLALSNPYWINVDNSGNLYFDDGNGYYLVPWSASTAKNLAAIPGAYNAGLLTPAPFSLDSLDDLYSVIAVGDDSCQIGGFNPNNDFEWIAAGSGICGYAANNVRAQNAEISPYITGFTTDVAGDLYFADAGNNVLRRVDAYNGLIRTVAGDFALGANDTGDGGPATIATLNSPIGVAVNSNGVIYTASYVSGAPGPYVTKKGTKVETIKPEKCVSNCGASTAAVIRQIGPQGQQNFPTALVGGQSGSKTILLTNVGNDYLNVTNQYLAGADPGDFVANGFLTSCNWKNTLPPGESCQLGYACAPKAAGLRTAQVILADNTATFQNVINLSCVGLAAPVTPTVVVNQPVNGAQYYNGSTVPVTVTVSNTIGPIATPPTGTVTLTLTNATTHAVVGTYGPFALTATGSTSQSNAYTTFPSLPIANYSVTAAYSGDTLDVAATSAADTFSIIQATPVVTISVPTGSTYVYGSSLPVSLTVSNANSLPVPPSAPTGTVTITITDETNPAKTIYNPVTLTVGTGGVSTYSTPDLYNYFPAGSYYITVVYNGDSINKTATSIPEPFTIIPATPTLSWPTPSFVYTGTPLSSTQLDALISSPLNLPGTFTYNPPAGTVENTVGTVTLNVTFTPTDNKDYNTVKGSVQLQVLQQITIAPKTTTTLVSKANPVSKGTAVELSATVKPVSGKATPTGEVTLFEGGKKLTTATLSSGAAKLSVTGLSAGTHILSAEYSGDKEHQGSTSKPVEQIVVTVGGAPSEPGIPGGSVR